MTSAYGGYSSCRQYLDDIASARRRVGRRCAQRRQAAALLQPPGLGRPWAATWPRALEATLGEARRARAQRPERRRRSKSSSPPTACPRPGCHQPLRGAPDRDGQAGGRRRPACRALAARLAEPLRAAQLALAGARHPRRHRGFARQHGGRGADRLRVRQHGDRPRPRRGGGCGRKGKRRKSGQGAPPSATAPALSKWSASWSKSASTPGRHAVRSGSHGPWPDHCPWDHCPRGR